MDVSASVAVDGATPPTPSESRLVTAVAVGGGAGAGARRLAGELLRRTDEVGEVADFPWATLSVNVIGCLVIAVAARRIARSGLGWAFWVTGGLGGFTTMSAVAVEVNGAADAGRTGMVVAYLLATLIGSALAFGLGDRLARREPNQPRDAHGADG